MDREGLAEAPPLTLIAPVVELVELLGELGQGLLDGLGPRHRQGKAALEVLHLVHRWRDQVLSQSEESR